MLLAIDIGNTNSVFAIHDGKEFIASWRCETVAKRTADEYYVFLKQLMDLNGIKATLDRVIVSSTVPRAVFNIRVLSDRYFDCRPIVVGKPETELGIDVRVDAGTTVGPDRLVNTVAAHDLYGGDLVVVDFGTATTFDVVDQDGAYIGGVIAPGVNLSMEALHAAAAALPHIDVTMPDKVIGTNTVECMQSGVFWGYVGLVEGICKQIRAEHPRKMKIIGTGGLASLFERGTDIFDNLETDLTLHGLKLIAERNDT
ncbi:type III pantothenate kinase [Amylibacter ulvae]|uniref:Type III pantothenate kinase n=1 Tax=Paramylibacter ulvae TaxID=1651968 RepID=A0ABQ3D1A0_9RHOB|nr:type III pantothenate kinase [Amylibacter ulvae]GHA53532.1 type III pantothenate kinase [Amylibacter ulvae]